MLAYLNGSNVFNTKIQKHHQSFPPLPCFLQLPQFPANSAKKQFHLLSVLGVNSVSLAQVQETTE